jgi:hypothetical protein
MQLMQLLLFLPAAALLVGTCSTCRLDALHLGCLLLCMGPTSRVQHSFACRTAAEPSDFMLYQQHPAQGSPKLIWHPCCFLVCSLSLALLTAWRSPASSTTTHACRPSTVSSSSKVVLVLLIAYALLKCACLCCAMMYISWYRSH